MKRWLILVSAIAAGILVAAAVLIGVLALTSDDDEGPSEVTQERAVELATEHASFEPCPEIQCVQIRYIEGGRSSQVARGAYWGIVLSDELDEDGEPNRTESFLVDVATGEVSDPCVSPVTPVCR